MHDTVEKWGVFEARFAGCAEGNPFAEVDFGATFSIGGRSVRATGFYDGDGTWVVRFMPDAEGRWTYRTIANRPELDGKSGAFECSAPGEGNHGPVHAADGYHFAYADGTRHVSVGTTCYAWVHQEAALADETLASLAASPFNKIRMMLFPKNYRYCDSEPPHHAYEDGPPNRSTRQRFNVAYFRNIDRRVAQLRDLGIEADIIFFTSYDFGRWGYDALTPDECERVIRYACARLSAYRNVWWSMANEYDLMGALDPADWDRFFRVTQECDPYHHLRSIHNAGTFYDHTKPWVTHCSIQHHETRNAGKWRETYGKPVVIDECSYEGNVAPIWGNLTAQEMVHRFWMGVCNGGYVGHGETYLNDQEILWWSRGGRLSGRSPERIGFLRRIVEEAPGGLNPVDIGWDCYACAGRPPDYYLYYTGNSQSLVREFPLPDNADYTVDVIDTWEMTITRLAPTFSGKCEIPLPGKPWQALRIQRAV